MQSDIADASPPVRIVIVKGDRLRADGMERAAREAYPNAEITRCHSGAEAAACLSSRPAWLGLVGLTLPDTDGLDLLARAGRKRWFSRILVVSGRCDERVQHGLRALNPDGFFDCTNDDPTGLPAVIRRVAEGGVYFSPKGEGPSAGLFARAATLEQMLTDTELQVFAVIGAGLSDAQAASRLGLGVTTVRSHRSHIMSKLGVKSSSEIVREAVRRGAVRLTESGRVLTPGQEDALAERAARGRSICGSSGAFEVA